MHARIAEEAIKGKPHAVVYHVDKHSLVFWCPSRQREKMFDTREKVVVQLDPVEQIVGEPLLHGDAQWQLNRGRDNARARHQMKRTRVIRFCVMGRVETPC